MVESENFAESYKIRLEGNEYLVCYKDLLIMFETSKSGIRRLQTNLLKGVSQSI